MGGTKYAQWEVRKSNPQALLSVLLANRGLKTAGEQNRFLSVPPPGKLTLAEVGLKKHVVEKLLKLVDQVHRQQKRIFIYGDYDADGICATAILWEALYAKGYDVLPYIPQRLTEGYGLRAESVKALHSQYDRLGLVITVDNGITANKEIVRIQKEGIKVAVIDHHQVGKSLPKAEVVVHTTQLCAAGIAWFVARELGLGKPTLELAAIGTVADQMPLLGPNRTLVKYGLTALSQTQRPGLKALFKEAGIKEENLGTYEINFVIAPRINATGRLTHGLDSLRLLCTRSPKKAKEYSQKIGGVNQQRQRMVDELLVLAKQQVIGGDKALIIQGEYHEGVIGLLAGKLTEEFGLPSLVFSVGETLAKASARSVAGVDIIAAIRRFDQYLVAGGGHPMAAGFTVEKKNLPGFIRDFTAFANREITQEVLGKKLVLDARLLPQWISLKTVRELKQLAPFGVGNPAPLFWLPEVKVAAVSLVGNGQHLKLKLVVDKQLVDAIAFGLGKAETIPLVGDKLDLALALEENIWNGKTQVQLKIKDFRVKT